MSTIAAPAATRRSVEEALQGQAHRRAGEVFEGVLLLSLVISLGVLIALLVSIVVRRDRRSSRNAGWTS